MEYTSTRDNARKATSAEAIVTGLAPDGGLFVPTSLPKMDFSALQGLSYTDTALQVLQQFLTDYDAAFLQKALAESYGAGFGGKVGELVRLDDSLYSLELWHGPTAAFKDYALQLMPRLLVQAKTMLNDTSETLVLVATSGDTGGAAQAGFQDVPGTKITVFYPEDGTSELQRLQMVTREGGNVGAYGVHGNFDDAQRGVKAAFVDAALAAALAAKNKKLSSANSINWGRLVPQVVYYVTSYLKLCEAKRIRYGDLIDFCVPTGNFGDIMAGWYAKGMGLPIGRLICASNKNNVLTDFLEAGHYNAKRPFHKTSSPSMDIVVSSNLERLLWHTCGSDATVRAWMADLAENDGYQVPAEQMERIRETFSAGWADEAAVYDELWQVYQEHHYLADPHTAVALRVCRETPAGDGRPVVVLSTASPYKFSRDVLRALGQPVAEDEFAAVRALEAFSGVPAPQSLATLSEKPVRFTDVIDASAIVGVPLTL
ncbi:MAG: threonine synthase [Ruminococcaceae bacterium]|nr:threonine synthase [Oscillospiraceae bacterium]